MIWHSEMGPQWIKRNRAVVSPQLARLDFIRIRSNHLMIFSIELFLREIKEFVLFPNNFIQTCFSVLFKFHSFINYCLFSLQHLLVTVLLCSIPPTTINAIAKIDDLLIVGEHRILSSGPDAVNAFDYTQF